MQWQKREREAEEKREWEREASHTSFEVTDLARVQVTVTHWSELKQKKNIISNDVLWGFYWSFWKRLLEATAVTSAHPPHTLSQANTRISTSMPTYCALPVLCCQLPSHEPLCLPSLLHACMCCLHLLWGVYLFVRVCNAMYVYVSLYDNLVFHWVSSLHSKTQPQEEDHSSFAPSYWHFTQWMMHCSRVHKNTHTRVYTVCFGMWEFVLCTCDFSDECVSTAVTSNRATEEK